METLDEHVAAVVILAAVKSAIELLELCLEVFIVQELQKYLEAKKEAPT